MTNTELAAPIYFLRHGQTDWNAKGFYQGSTDTSLSEIGKAEAAQNAAVLLRQLDADAIDPTQVMLVSSPLTRARQTADIVAQHLDPAPPITVNPAFRELSIGRWEGMTSPQVKETYYKERKSRKSDRWAFKPQGGESMAERCDEVKAALLQLQPNTIVVTHCVVLRIIFHLLCGLDRQHATKVETPHVSVWCWNSAKLHRQA
ncbi:MAG: histidine phosphatase family protein [Rhizobiaceae bacterium]